MQTSTMFAALAVLGFAGLGSCSQDGSSEKAGAILDATDDNPNSQS